MTNIHTPVSRMTRMAYINDFLYFTFGPYGNGGNGALLYCSGVDVDRFYPITKGRHRPMANPVIRGLQLVNLGVRALALKEGARPVTIKGDHCIGITAAKNGWYRESILIENASASFPQDATAYSVVELMRKMDKSIMLGENMPEEPLPAAELQVFLESLCKKYGG